MKKRILTKFLAFIMVFGAVSAFAPLTALAQPSLSAPSTTTIPAGETRSVSVGLDVPSGFVVTDIGFPQGQQEEMAHILNARITNGGTLHGPASRNLVIEITAMHGFEGQTSLTLLANWLQTGTGLPAQQISVNIPIIVTRSGQDGSAGENISITSPTAPVELAPGESRVVPVTVRNFGSTNITNINFLPRLFVGNPNVTVEIEGNLSQFSLNANATRTINFRLTAAENAPAGSQNGRIEFSHTIGGGNAVNFDEIVIPVVIAVPDALRPVVVMESFTTTPSGVGAGQNFTFNVTLRNTTAVDAVNTTLSWAIPSGALQIRGTNSSNIGTIPAFGTREVAIQLTTAQAATSGSYPISITLRHDHQTPVGGETVNYHIAVGDQASAERANISIVAISAPSGSFLPGQEARFSITIQNIGVGRASNVRITASPETGVVSRLASIQTLDALEPGQSRTFEFAFAPTSAATNRFHNIGFTVAYHDGGQNQTFEQFSGMAVTTPEAEGARADLQITSIIAPTAQFSSGQEAAITLIVTNLGETIARNVRITATPETGLVSRLASIQTMPSLEPGQSRAFEFAFAPTATATNRFHNVGFTVSYNDGQATQTFEQYSGISVRGVDGGNQSVPRVIISDYTVDPLMVMANTEFDLYLTLQNTHSARTISNMRVTLEVIGTATAPGGQTTPSAVFTPVNASNTFFIDSISPRATAQHHIRLFAIPDAAPMNHTIVVHFVYEDEEGNEITARENIGINVRQESRVELGDPSFMMPSVGSPMTTSFNVHNSGRSTVFNLRVHFEGDGFDTSQADERFGNVQPGHGGQFWGSITPIMPGQQTLYMITTFEDVMAQEHTIIREFHLYVTGGFGGGDWEGGGDDRWPPDGGFPGDGGPWGEEEDGSNNTLLWILIGGGVVLAVGIAAIIVIRKKRAKKEDFDDFDV
ncbi:MAG: hypothetical protein FWE44_04185 [Defluviitaleaceae bacterium]|nr:hypothetical protein [Defluviitaleaceae bacterium]